MPRAQIDFQEKLAHPPPGIVSVPYQNPKQKSTCIPESGVGYLSYLPFFPHAAGRCRQEVRLAGDRRFSPDPA